MKKNRTSHLQSLFVSLAKSPTTIASLVNPISFVKSVISYSTPTPKHLLQTHLHISNAIRNSSDFPTTIPKACTYTQRLNMKREKKNFGTIPLKAYVLSPNYRLVIAITFHMLSFPVIAIHFPNGIAIRHTKRGLRIGLN